MISPVSSVYLILLCGLVVGQLLVAFFSKDKSFIWSPLTFIGLTLLYYIVWPIAKGDLRGYDISVEHQSLFFLSAIVFYLSVLVGFYLTHSKTRFERWNQLISTDNAGFIAISIFLFALICYVPFRGFRTTIWSSDDIYIADRTGFVSYFIDLISVFCASCCILLVLCKHRRKLFNWLGFAIVLYFSLVIYIVGGFRVRLVYLLVSMATAYHLFPRPRRIHYVMVLTVSIFTFLLFAVMDVSRNYGRGLNRDEIGNISFAEASKGARENAAVLYFSVICTDHYYRTGERFLFQPLVNAVFMPLPRAVFPWKPDGHYIRDVQQSTLGSPQAGAAFLCFTEAYVSFGMLGVILYGLLLGWLSRIIFGNYKKNADSISAIVLLAVFNGFTYQWISRGYLGSNFNSFLYYCCLPFWLASIFRRVFHW